MRNQNSQTIKAFVICESHIFRSGLRTILESQAIDVIGEESMTRASVDTICRDHPDVVLVDLDPRGPDGLMLIGALCKSSEHPAVLIVADLADHDSAHKSLALGASGIVLKMQPPSVLVAAVRELCHSLPKAAKTDAYPTPTSRKLMKLSDDQADTIKLDSLTTREREIIRLIGLGLKNKDIANRLSISDITVRHHLTSIFCKLGITDRQNLLIMAYRCGLADLSFSTESTDRRNWKSAAS
jgi:DNA-binding NarL/FixJ family response regulator